LEDELMGKLYIPIEISDDNEAKFRDIAFKKFSKREGGKMTSKGNLKKAATEAFLDWIQKNLDYLE
jgi:hypothetical protein